MANETCLEGHFEKAQVTSTNQTLRRDQYTWVYETTGHIGLVFPVLSLQFGAKPFQGSQKVKAGSNEFELGSYKPCFLGPILKGKE